MGLAPIEEGFDALLLWSLRRIQKTLRAFRFRCQQSWLEDKIVTQVNFLSSQHRTGWWGKGRADIFHMPCFHRA